MDDTPDKDFIRRYLDGDERALEALIRRHLRAVYNFVIRFTGTTTEADDIVADTFVKAWKSIRRFDTEKSFKVWLFAIARNTAIDVMRKKKMPVISDFENSDDFTLAEKIPSDEVPLEDVLDAARDHDAARMALTKLPSIYQTVLLMRYDQDMTFQDISDILGESINTVKSRYRRAIMLLKDSFKKN